MHDDVQPVPSPRSRRQQLGLVAYAALPGALTVFLCFRSGGFFPGVTALVAAQLALLLAWRISVARRPLEGVGPSLLIAAGALALLAGWTLASSNWSNAPGRAIVEYDRVVLYLVTLLLFGTLARSVRRLRWMVHALAAGIVAVAIAALAARLFPGLELFASPVHRERLSYPLTYWNSLGLLTGIGTVLCGHLACSEREPPLARILGAAAVPLLAATLYYTFSRGATWAALVAVVIYVVVGRPRAVLPGAVAMIPAVVIALAAINPASVLTRDPTSPAAIDAGGRIALVLALCAAGSGLLRGLLLPLDGRLPRISPSIRSRRIMLAGAGVLALALSAGVAVQAQRLVSDKVAEFRSDDNVDAAGSGRLLQFSNNGRIEHWAVALASFRRDRVSGHGAGTYALDWDRERHALLDIEDAHSLYLEVLGELGVPGLLALTLCLLMILGAFAARARGPDRALFAALLAAGIAWAIHAAIDWDWEMPAVTLWLFAFGGAALAQPRAARADGRRAAPLVRVAGVAACLALAIVPLRLALSDAHLEEAMAMLRHGDCAAATAAAVASNDILGSRPEPFQVIGFCERHDNHPAAALAAMQAGLRRDPDNWELQYAVAVTRAVAGLNPGPAARRAARLNPRSPIAQHGVSMFATGDREDWRRRGRRAPLTLPD